MHVHDVDGDGDKDTVFGNSDQTATTYYKDGTGGLEEDPEGPTGDGWGRSRRRRRRWAS